jgi:hypothetical protein
VGQFIKPSTGVCPALGQLNWAIVTQIKHAALSGIAIDLEDAAKILQYLECIFFRNDLARKSRQAVLTASSLGAFSKTGQTQARQHKSLKMHKVPLLPDISRVSRRTSCDSWRTSHTYHWIVEFGFFTKLNVEITFNFNDLQSSFAGQEKSFPLCSAQTSKGIKCCL